jgi:hypothetical protein
VAGGAVGHPRARHLRRRRDRVRREPWRRGLGAVAEPLG